MIAAEQKVELTADAFGTRLKAEDYAAISGIIWLFWALPASCQGYYKDKQAELERLAYACGDIAGLPRRNDPFGARG